MTTFPSPTARVNCWRKFVNTYRTDHFLLQCRSSPVGPRVSNGPSSGMSAIGLCVQLVSATPLAVYRLAFGSPRSFADAD
jgi:hypothetical protein